MPTIKRHQECNTTLDQHPPRDEAERVHVPVFHAEIPAKATIKGVATAMLNSLGDPAPDRGTTVSQGLRLAHLIEHCGVELVLLDEFQHLIDNRTQRVVQDVSDWIKSLINSTKVPMILIGMPESEDILEENPQLKRRFMVRKRLAPFSWKTDQDQLEFRKFLAEVEKKLPFEAASSLAEMDLAFALYVASGGTAANVMTLIKQAARFAILDADERLDRCHFSRAFELRSIDNDTLPQNPFSVDVRTIKSWPMIAKVFEKSLGSNNRVQPKKRRMTASEVLRRS